MYVHISTVYEGKKPFICNICDSSFTQKFHLNDHIVTVHEENKFFKCNISDSVFTTKPNLKNHIASNSKKKLKNVTLVVLVLHNMST